jgi:Nucleotidyltransferase of unknown function (DUF6036)
MEPISVAVLKTFLQRLSELYPKPATIYLLGGSALCLLGSPRETLDVDYTFDLEPQSKNIFTDVVNKLATELKLDLEAVPLDEFIPLPADALERRIFFHRYGLLDVYIYDLYSIALSKIARGFESDLEDVQFMLTNQLIDMDKLEHHFQEILPNVKRADIDPKEFQFYFSELKRRLTK